MKYFLSSDPFHNNYPLSNSHNEWPQTAVYQPCIIRRFLYQSVMLTVPGDMSTIKIRDSIKTPDAHVISICIDNVSHPRPLEYSSEI